MKFQIVLISFLTYSITPGNCQGDAKLLVPVCLPDWVFHYDENQLTGISEVTDDSVTGFKQAFNNALIIKAFSQYNKIRYLKNLYQKDEKTTSKLETIIESEIIYAFDSADIKVENKDIDRYGETLLKLSFMDSVISQTNSDSLFLKLSVYKNENETDNFYNRGIKATLKSKLKTKHGIDSGYFTFYKSGNQYDLSYKWNDHTIEPGKYLLKYCSNRNDTSKLNEYMTSTPTVCYGFWRGLMASVLEGYFTAVLQNEYLGVKELTENYQGTYRKMIQLKSMAKISLVIKDISLFENHIKPDLTIKFKEL